MSDGWNDDLPKERWTFVPKEDITVFELAEVLASMNLFVPYPDKVKQFSEKTQRHWELKPRSFDYLSDKS